MSVLRARAVEQATKDNTLFVPLGLEFPTALEATADQCMNLPGNVRRIVVPVGSGQMFLGVVRGIKKYMNQPPDLIGVYVGKKPNLILPRWATVAEAPFKFNQEVEEVLDNLELDPVYEAKCIPFLKRGDLLWIVAHRDTE